MIRKYNFCCQHLHNTVLIAYIIEESAKFEIATNGNRDVRFFPTQFHVAESYTS